MKVYKIELSIIDFDNLGPDGIKHALEDTRYPNDCIGPLIVSMDSRDIEWTDEHLLNNIDTWKTEFTKLFQASEPPKGF